MKTLYIIGCMLLFACCSYSQTKKDSLMEKKGSKPAVKLLPNDSSYYNMPIQKRIPTETICLSSVPIQPK